jgi:hypothetical protein
MVSYSRCPYITQSVCERLRAKETAEAEALEKLRKMQQAADTSKVCPVRIERLGGARERERERERDTAKLAAPASVRTLYSGCVSCSLVACCLLHSFLITCQALSHTPLQAAIMPPGECRAEKRALSILDEHALLARLHAQQTKPRRCRRAPMLPSPRRPRHAMLPPTTMRRYSAAPLFKKATP